MTTHAVSPNFILSLHQHDYLYENFDKLQDSVKQQGPLDVQVVFNYWNVFSPNDSGVPSPVALPCLPSKEMRTLTFFMNGILQQKPEIKK